ncbi:MAG: [FeFe] hydrogenase H-cluster radical SAM maturase HydG [Oligoflexia bacterium]|nr:[FeFe] hydrogenase H-cluster radical SAM maturase HydG [Oligoflexia bacterium]
MRILKNSLDGERPTPKDVLTLLEIKDPELLQELYRTANQIKNTIYGNRIVIFAPLYLSNFCQNECLYCAFRKGNLKLKRNSLDQNDIISETKALLEQGHKRLLLVMGESNENSSQLGLDYMIESISTIYSVECPTSSAAITDTKHKNRIRRINVNMAPLSVEGFKKLQQSKIGTFQIFQETYHQPTYKLVHPKGPKSDYDFRLHTIDRAFQAGIPDVGIGVLFGLHDYRYEILALLQHITHLENTYGVGPHTISVPRIEPAFGSELSYNIPSAVDDETFCKIMAVLRIAVPYTGIILSTRENKETRTKALQLGISQISAGSRTNPGGYSDFKNDDKRDAEQFSLGDHRTLLEVIKDLTSLGYIPSFCTGCYRKGRVGKDFMDLAEPGAIKNHCQANAILTFSEYLQDFADPQLVERGEKLIEQTIHKEWQSNSYISNLRNTLTSIKNGERDIYL